jgi:hypothetical protein
MYRCSKKAAVFVAVRRRAMYRYGEQPYDTIPRRTIRRNSAIRFLCTVCIIVLVTPLYFGCGDFFGVNAPGNTSGDPSIYHEETGASRSRPRSGKPVKAPVDILYTVQNPLEIHPETITQETDGEEGTERNYVVISISGLKDKEVEKKVNDRIRQAYEDIKAQGLPPFRGIKAAIPENALLAGDSIYCYAAANFNNILSVCISRDSSYALPNNSGDYLKHPGGYYLNTEYVYVLEGLTFDLNTGNEITLADVFADNVDYLALLNDAVVKELNASSAQDEGYFTRWYGLKLAAPFKGLLPEQKFFLDSSGLNLIFDYATPEFYSPDFSIRTIHIPYGDLDGSVAVTERFYEKGENIFTSEDAPIKTLMQSGYYSSVPIQKEEYRDGRVSVFCYTLVSPSFPDGLMERVMEMSSVSQGKIDEMNRALAAESTHWNEEDVNGYFEQRVNASTVGHYATITKHISGATREAGFFSMEYLTYGRNTGKELTLADMFISGFDYLALVRKAFEKTIVDYGGLYRDGRKMSAEESVERLNEILAENLDFCPNSDSISIVAGEAEFTGGYREPLHINLTFEEIGYENLTLFEEH